MKKFLLFSVAAIAGLLFMQASPEPTTDPTPQEGFMPANVKAIVDAKCYGCHNASSKNDKAKAALDWDALGKLKKAKRMAAMDEIKEVLENGEMPPKKFLEFKPEAKLSDADVATLKEWSNASGKKKKS